MRLTEEILESIFLLSQNPHLLQVCHSFYDILSPCKAKFIALGFKNPGRVDPGHGWFQYCLESHYLKRYLVYSTWMNEDILLNLLYMGCYPHVDGYYSLRLCAERGWVRGCHLILQDSCPSSLPFPSLLNNLLKTSSYYGHISLVPLFISKGAQVHIHDYYPLRAAASNGHLELVKLFIQEYHCYAGIDAMNGYCQKFAALNGHWNIVEYLLSVKQDTLYDKHYN